MTFPNGGRRHGHAQHDLRRHHRSSSTRRRRRRPSPPWLRWRTRASSTTPSATGSPTSGIFVLQCGDPTGTGSGGPGYTIPDENLPKAGADGAALLPRRHASPWPTAAAEHRRQPVLPRLPGHPARPELQPVRHHDAGLAEGRPRDRQGGHRAVDPTCTTAPQRAGVVDQQCDGDRCTVCRGRPCHRPPLAPPETYGRVEPDGTVWVRTSSGEVRVGPVPGR